MSVVSKQQDDKERKKIMKSDQLDKMSKSSKQTIHIETEYDKFDLKGYSCELSANSFIPISRKNQIKERNFFNNHQDVTQKNIFNNKIK